MIPQSLLTVAAEIGEHESSIFGIQMPNVVLWLLALAVIAGAAHTLWTKAVKPIARVVRTVHATYEKVMEYDGRISHVEENTMQLTRNSGSHLADAVYRIEAKQDSDHETLTTHLDWSRAEAEHIRSEVADVWKNLAARDTVKAALKAAEAVDESHKDDNK